MDIYSHKLNSINDAIASYEISDLPEYMRAFKTRLLMTLPQTWALAENLDMYYSFTDKNLWDILWELNQCREAKKLIDQTYNRYFKIIRIIK